MTGSHEYGSSDLGTDTVAGDSPLGGYSPGGYPQREGLPPVPPPPAMQANYAPPRQQQDTSTTDVAKDQASQVAGGAADAAQHVAGVAKEQLGQVTQEATRQVKDLLGQAQSELTDQAQGQQEKLAGGLHAVGDQLKSMANGSDQSGLAVDLAHQAADKAHEFAGWLEGRDPGSVLNEVRSFARRRPGAFLAIALGAGVVAGRLARGLTADSGETDSARTSSPRPQRIAGYPAPPAVGYDGGTPALMGSASSGASARPALDLPAGLDAERYGTGAVPDWTGKPASDVLGDVR